MFYQIQAIMNFKATSKVRGDETQSFDVTDYKATTVGEFVDEVLSGNGKKEWGYFEFISVKPQKVGKWNIPPEWNRYEYKRGSLLDKIPDTLLNKRIERVTGNGGWSNMDYDITVVDENGKEKENEYCKQHCKGFQDTGGKCFVDDCRKNETENDVRIGDRVFVDGTEVFNNTKGITYDTSGVSINEDAETSAKRWYDKFQRLRKFTEDTLRDLIYTETRYGNKDLAFQFFCDKIDEIVNDK